MQHGAASIPHWDAPPPRYSHALQDHRLCSRSTGGPPHRPLPLGQHRSVLGYMRNRVLVRECHRRPQRWALLIAHQGDQRGADRAVSNVLWQSTHTWYPDLRTGRSSTRILPCRIQLCTRLRLYCGFCIKQYSSSLYFCFGPLRLAGALGAGTGALVLASELLRARSSAASSAPDDACSCASEAALTLESCRQAVLVWTAADDRRLLKV